MDMLMARHASGLVIVALLTALLTLGSYAVLFPATIRATVGANDSLVFRGFHDLETGESFAYRWSGEQTSDGVRGASTIALPQLGTGAGALDLHIAVPGGRPALPLTLQANAQPLLTLPIAATRQQHLLVPAVALSSGNGRFDLLTALWSPPGDARSLGVAVLDTAWTPLGRMLPPVEQLVVLPLIALLLAVLLLRLGLGPVIALAIGLSAGATLAITAATLPLDVAPFTHRVLWAIALAHAALLVWSTILRSGQRWWHLPQPIDAAALLVLLGVSYWLVLPFQYGMRLDTAGAIGPRLGTQWIGAVTLAVLVLVAVVPRLTAWRLRSAQVVLALSGLAKAIYAATFAFRRSGPDFFILWRAAYDFHLGRPLYKIADVLANHFGHVFKVPPFYGMLFLPFATSDDNFILLLHRALNCTLLVINAALLAWLLVTVAKPRIDRWTAATGALMLVGLMQPAFDTVAYGQIDIMLLLLLTLALVGLREQRSWLVGLAIALGTLFKLYPFMLIGLLVMRREWRAVGWTAAWLTLLNAVAISVMGWQNHVLYVTEVLPNIGGGTSWVENQTINGFLSRLLLGTMQTDPVHDPLVNLLTYAGFAGVCGIALVQLLRPADRHSALFALQFSQFAIVMVMAVPAAWMHYETVTILVFGALLMVAAEQPTSRGRAAAIAVSYALIAFGNQWSFFDGTRHTGLPALALSYKFYGLVILWTVTNLTIAALAPLRFPRLLNSSRSDIPVQPHA